MVTFNDNGTIEFPVVPPLPAPDMRPDPGVVSQLVARVEETLRTIDAESQCRPTLRFRPGPDGMELYQIQATVPGTIPLRTARTTWKQRRRKR